MKDARCSTKDGDLFFPKRGDKDSVHKAKALCALCPVRQDCLDYAVRNHEHYGIWGGLTRDERRGMRAVRRPVVIRHGTVTGYKAHLRLRETPCGACKEANASYQRRARAEREAS